MKILVSGSSWTAGSILPGGTMNPFNWTKQLAKELSCEVANWADSGMSADYVVRSIITELERVDYDVVIAALPALTNRREVILRDESAKDAKFQYIPLSGVPFKPMADSTGRFIGARKQSIIDDWSGYIMNSYEDFSNYFKNIILLGELLKGRKHIMMFDIYPFHFMPNPECDNETNVALATLQKLSKNYISYQETMIQHLQGPGLIDSTEHPSDLGHELLGKMFAEKVRAL